ncbi:response regulator transcription factor [Staphylococcus gallinarum]|uniref:response regulator transcription factor n=3 Tax=Staphylococcus gallinarum TaxID=1293 RepID=UPI000E678401|nr:response regulator transcription factor [Staphylococcus gallinarum]MBU7217156.1 response regulator transcription factor [Staphylococcus gallinarum]RIL19449.1 DNA-binding response regulator [Staphylococcus gallinarum]RIL26587.1 DNA-binding response regulator [Staphylococcus gallinarum]RIO98170.1 DNA-binding response regulator [Staphylococcus gallinarum]
MKGYHILIVEDDSIISKNLKLIFEQNEAKVTIDATGNKVFKYLGKVHLIVMDIMLPYNDGLSLTDIIRQHTDIPIIYLSARSDINSKIQGLGNGDDYLTKPFDPRELISRIDNLINRFYGEETIKIQNLTINLKQRTVLLNDDFINFTKTETIIFFYLVSQKDSILTKEQIINYVWADGNAFENTLNVYIKKIRRKINDTNDEIIQTVYGVGYKLNSR